MTRFNKKEIKIVPTTLNKAGGQAYTESPELEVSSILLTSFMNDKFYSSTFDQEARLIKAISELKDKKFAAKAAIYARTKFHMRSITHFTAAEIAKQVKGESWTRSFYKNVISRADDATEIAAAYLRRYGKPLPNSLRRGIADRLETFDAYSLAKYKSTGKEISMIDLVNLVHPKYTEALTALMTGTLDSADTWEVALAKSGQDATDEISVDQLKGEAWVRLVRSEKLPYFALLRNLRNIMEQAPEVLDEALLQLVDEKKINKSKVLPFRFVTAYNQFVNISGSQKILKALATAINISVNNVPDFEGTTLVVLDESGSMGDEKDSKSPFGIGVVFAAALIKKGADFMGFSNDASYRMFTGNDVMSDINAISKSRVNGGTNFHSIFSTANRKYDRIIILSDMQGWIGQYSPAKEFTEYKKKYNADPKIYSFDLQGLGTLQFLEQNVYALAGFSDKVFDLMALLEAGDKQALINEINKVEL